MATAPTFTKTGNVSSRNTTLPETVFSVPSVSHDLLHQAYTIQRSHQHARGAHTKTRGDVRASGRKIKPQKYMGGARAGTSTSPMRRGGGVAFGPQGNQTRRKQMNKSAKRAALRHALTLQAQEASVIVVEDFAFDGKTKTARGLLDALGVGRLVTCVVAQHDPYVQRSLRNIPGALLTDAASLNVADVLDADFVIFTRNGLEALQQRMEAPS
jgi:large subunit ribosomal protein L4